MEKFGAILLVDLTGIIEESLLLFLTLLIIGKEWLSLFCSEMLLNVGENTF